MGNLFQASLNFPYYFTSFPIYYWSPVQNPPQFTSSNLKTQKVSNTNLKIETQSNEAFPQKNQSHKVSKTIKIKKTKLHKKKKSKSPQVNDFLKKKKDKNFSSKHQKNGRNMPSIIFRLFILYILKDANIQILYQPIASMYKLSNDHNEFFKKFKQYFPQQKKYIRRGLIEDISFNRIQQPQFSLAFRILLRNFLKAQIFSTVYCSSKLARKNKIKEAKFVKKAFKMIFDCEYVKKQTQSNQQEENDRESQKTLKTYQDKNEN